MFNKTDRADDLAGVSKDARIAVAMSGGVDSSVAALLLQREGFRVEGFTMRLWRADVGQRGAPRDDITSARSVCDLLGIPHRVVDLRNPFRQDVVDHFVNEYAHGRTPNPCVRCNRLLKFGRLLDMTLAQGYDYLATGHYARIRRRDDGYYLLKGLDESKDQSYFLCQLSQRQLRHAIFPLGTHIKQEVRELAGDLLPLVAERSESQDVCFLSERSYRAFIAEQAPEAVRPGPIWDREGHVLGEHEGLPFYTIGQRRGLGIAAPRPLYVLSLDLEKNVLIVGYREELGANALLARQMRYVSGHSPRPGERVQGRIRYRARGEPARFFLSRQGMAKVIFERQLRDITPGQIVALYDGPRVLGGGTIWKVYRSRDAEEGRPC